jgi:alpha-ketoglutarate-dependent taurine dioxygenase
MNAEDLMLGTLEAVAIEGSPQLMIAQRDRAGATDWIGSHRERVLRILQTKGWVLVRGLDIDDPDNFRRCVTSLGLSVSDDYGDLPRGPAGVEGVFGVTPFPPAEAILFHHEGAHTPRPPRYLCFNCSVAAARGGETPLADSSRVVAALASSIREEFVTKGLLYRRHFLPGLDVSWQHYFQTRDRKRVESICRSQGIRASWSATGGLLTETQVPAIVPHPDSGRAVFFNQILLHHPRCLDHETRVALAASLAPDCPWPRDVRFGDGALIPDEWIAAVLEAHIRVAVAFRWQPGDLLVIDNFAIAHARRPYVGQRRHHAILSRALEPATVCGSGTM